MIVRSRLRYDENLQRQIWPKVCGQIGHNPEIKWDNVPPNCKTVDIKIVDLGGDPPFENEGRGYVHLYLKNVPVQFGGIGAGKVSDLEASYGVRNSAGYIGFSGFTPPHPPHQYQIQVTACKQTATVTGYFYGK